MLPILCYEATTTLIQKNRQRYYQKKILTGQYHDEHRRKNPQQNTSKLNPAVRYLKKDMYMYMILF